jgi:hypothetical protein
MFRLTGYEDERKEADCDGRDARRTPSYVNVLQGLWLFLLLLWLPFAGLCGGMAFDGGRTTGAYVVIWTVWTYPLSVVIAWILKRGVPVAILLPFANILVLFAF